ncbi:DNA-binding NarL/FixJ family response regulator [Peribacillus frigoritolerans]|uniref:LuxR C-terminal-related transcriptional regulator n=1 Tax=Peribacillus frigoritolerans TaxID=450367 RepID=UPI00209D65A9|nr:response regulator transcription factor [Peribacillus frigoritolerans]MCP1491122.1 DNA-binding NarL/FixJ family response regulator [Peribacillus frigoritolerans]
MKSIKLMIYGGQGGIEGIIEKEGDIKVMGMNGNEMDLLDSDHTSVMPDVILIDARSSGKYGQEVMQFLKEKHPSTPFVIFTDYSENHYLIEAIGHGAAGYVLQDGGTKQVLSAIRQCANGQIVYPASFKSILMKKLERDVERSPVTLEKAIGKLGAFSKREHELLILLTQGETNQQISKKLFLSIGTVKNYISRIYRKLNVNNRPELMALLYGLQNSEMKG